MLLKGWKLAGLTKRDAEQTDDNGPHAERIAASGFKFVPEEQPLAVE